MSAGNGRVPVTDRPVPRVLSLPHWLVVHGFPARESTHFTVTCVDILFGHLDRFVL
jgi:hypothetical protein